MTRRWNTSEFVTQSGTQAMTYNDLTNEYGKPIFQMELTHYPKEERMLYDIPYKIAVFEQPDRAEKIIVYGKVGQTWIPNHGQTALIRELLAKAKLL